MSAGAHENCWDALSPDHSRFMVVPVFVAGKKFGNLEVAFAPIGGFLGLNHWALLGCSLS
ncbi:MAG: hypothetical protein R3C56_23280 [Pirellulaceae bacterium]